MNPKAETAKKAASPAVLTPHKGPIPVDQRMFLFNRKGAPGVITLAQRGRITNVINLALYMAARTPT